MDAPRRTKIDGVGVTAASSSVASTYAAETDIQHPHGTVITVDVFICHTSSTAAGVTIAILSGISTPFIVIAIAMGVTVPPVGIAMFPCTVTSYLAKLLEVLPFKVRTPVAIGTTHPLLHGIDTTLNGITPLRATF